MSGPTIPHILGTSLCGRRLGGQKNEAFHINECGWLREEMSNVAAKRIESHATDDHVVPWSLSSSVLSLWQGYCRLRALLMDLRASGSLSFQRMNLKDMHPTDGPTA